MIRLLPLLVWTLVAQPVLARTAPDETPRKVDREFVVSIVGAPEDTPPATAEALEEKTFAAGLLLRCPVCQGSAIADSPSPTAINMKNEVRDLMALGFSQAQVLRYFEASYGQFVLMEPKAEGLNWLVWLLPGVLLLAGLVFVGVWVRRLSAGRTKPEDEAPGRGTLPGDQALATYVKRVRELAYGWPDGAPPSEQEGG